MYKPHKIADFIGKEQFGDYKHNLKVMKIYKGLISTCIALPECSNIIQRLIFLAKLGHSK